MAEKKRVLFLCTGNSARSQIAEGLLRHLAGDHFEVFSAGTLPSYVRAHAIAVMNEIGIDISDHVSKSLNEFLNTPFDYVITVCDHAGQRCPAFPGPAKRIHWSIEDPVGFGPEEAELDAFRTARDELQKRLRAFIEQSEKP
jgi:arsenate reductase (thioredoxin)